MQEQVNEKTVALTVRGAKLTGRLLAKAMRAALLKMKQARDAPPRGKQTFKQLAQQNAGLSNIEITNQNIKSFEPYARKYGIDFALKKDASVTPPKWMVFFKGRDADAMTVAFSEFSAKMLKRSAAKPSVLAQLNRFKELVKNTVIDRVKNKDRGGPER
nr:PcfB family protein [Sedimentibacter sp.]